LFLNWIAGKNINSLKQPTFDVLRKVKENKPISEIVERMNQQLCPKTKDGEIIKVKQIESIVLERLKDEVFYENWFRPLLALIEYETKKRDIKYIEMDKKLHVEHILPEKYATNRENEWAHITPEIEKKYLYRAGNLTLLDNSQNPEAYNWGLEKKIPIYEGKGKNNDKATGVTSFEITRLIIDDFKQSKFNKDVNNKQIWDEMAIKKRFNWFCEKVERALNIDTSSIKEPIQEV